MKALALPAWKLRSSQWREDEAQTGAARSGGHSSSGRKAGRSTSIVGHCRSTCTTSALSRSESRSHGRDSTRGQTWNVGGPTLDHWRGEWLWYDFGDGPEAVEYRPEGIYVYGELESARECARFYAVGGRSGGRDIWEIALALVPQQLDIIIDPAWFRWDTDEVHAYVFERVPAAAVRLLVPGS